MIPKVIVQTSLSPPNFYRVAKIKEYCPGWEYQHYDDAGILNFFKENNDPQFPNLEENFSKLREGAHKADFFRYYYLFKKGGVYMDTDLMIHTEIESIIKNYKFVSVTTLPIRAFNGFICTVPKHIILYLAFRHIYTLCENLEKNEKIPYHTFCEEFMKIINRFRDSTVNMDLTENIKEETGISEIKNSDGQHVLTHYFRQKVIPVTFLTKSNDYSKPWLV